MLDSCLKQACFAFLKPVPKHEIKVELDLEPGLAELVWEDVGDFFNMHWLFPTRRLELSGDPKVLGATRKYPTGGIETLTGFDDDIRCMTWSLDRIPDYQGSLHVKDNKLCFQVEAKAPHALLHIEEVTVREQLRAVVWEAKQRLNLSKACIITTVTPLTDPDKYERVVKTRLEPALRALMAQADLLQYRLDLDKAGKEVRSYQVWKDSETSARHMQQTFFSNVMKELRPFVDTPATLSELHAWGDFGHNFSEQLGTSPQCVHPTGDCAVFIFKSAMDTNRNHIILQDKLRLKLGTMETCKQLLHQLRLLARPLAEHCDLLDLRLHLAGHVLYRFQVFNSHGAFERHVLDEEAPYGRALSQLTELAEGPPTGSVWGPCSKRMRSYFHGGIAQRRANLVEVLSRRECPDELVETPNEVPSYSREDRDHVHRLLKELDNYTWTMLDMLPSRTLSIKQSLETEPYEVNEPRIATSEEDHVKMGSLPFRVDKTDDHFGDLEMMDRAVFTIMANGSLFPVDDRLIDVPDELVDCMKHELLFDKIIEPPHHHLTEISSDEAIERMITSGVCSLWLRDHMDGFKVDYSCMGDLDPRPSFRRLGATAYLNADCKLTSIHVCESNTMFQPGDDGWEDAKMLFKTSAAQWNTGVDHLTGVHMVATNSVVVAAVRHLPPDHTIRRWLQPFCFRSTYVNQRALKSLLDPHSIVLHACGYDVSNFQRLLEKGVKTCNFWQTPADRIDSAGPGVRRLVSEGRFPLGEDSIRLYEVFRPFAEDWVNGAYATDDDIHADRALQAFAADLHGQTQHAAACTPELFKSKAEVVRFMATFLTNATGMHEYAGTVQEYIAHPKYMGFRARVGSDRVDMQAWLLGLLLFSVTSLPMPQILNDFGGCFTEDEERKSWQACQSRLRRLSEQIDAENATKRTFPFQSFNPKVLECSVSV